MRWSTYEIFSVLSGLSLIVLALTSLPGEPLRLSKDRVGGFASGVGFIGYGWYAGHQTSGTFFFPIWIFVIPFGVVGVVIVSVVTRHAAGEDKAKVGAVQASAVQLAVDGAFGRRTMGRLQQWAGVPITNDLSPSAWRAVQRKVGRGLAIDGVAGKETWLAIQSLVACKQDGRPGSQTYRALQSYLNAQASDPTPTSTPVMGVAAAAASSRKLGRPEKQAAAGLVAVLAVVGAGVLWNQSRGNQNMSTNSSSSFGQMLPVGSCRGVPGSGLTGGAVPCSSQHYEQLVLRVAAQDQVAAKSECASGLNGAMQVSGTYHTHFRAELALGPNPWDCWVTVDGAGPGQEQPVTGSLLDGTAVFQDLGSSEPTQEPTSTYQDTAPTPSGDSVDADAAMLTDQDVTSELPAYGQLTSDNAAATNNSAVTPDLCKPVGGSLAVPDGGQYRIRTFTISPTSGKRLAIRAEFVVYPDVEAATAAGDERAALDRQCLSFLLRYENGAVDRYTGSQTSLGTPSVLVALQQRVDSTLPSGEVRTGGDYEVVLRDRRIVSVVTFDAPDTGNTFSTSDVSKVVTAQASRMSAAQGG
jgi:hypothetical protein